MGKKIAVLVDSSGYTSDFSREGYVRVYNKDNGGWRVLEEIHYSIERPPSLISIRINVRKLTEELGECRVLVGSEVLGIAYNILDSAGFNTWEINGMPEEFLDFVMEKEEEKAEDVFSDKKVGKAGTVLKELKEGHFYINLKKLQEENSIITSKQVLLPFLTNTVFTRLEVVCSHIPPWFESQFKKLNVKSKVQQIASNEFKVIISPEN